MFAPRTGPSIAFAPSSPGPLPGRRGPIHRVGCAAPDAGPRAGGGGAQFSATFATCPGDLLPAAPGGGSGIPCCCTLLRLKRAILAESFRARRERVRSQHAAEELAWLRKPALQAQFSCICTVPGVRAASTDGPRSVASCALLA